MLIFSCIFCSSFGFFHLLCFFSFFSFFVLSRTAFSRTALHWTASPGPPKISLFFSLPPQFHSFSFPLLGSSRGTVVVFLKAGTLICARLGSLAALGPPGYHTTTRELQTCTFEDPGASKHNQNSTRRPPERQKKERKLWRERDKESANFFGAPTLCAPPFGAPLFRGTTLLGPLP